MTTNQDYEDADDQQGFADLREGRSRRITPEVLQQEQDVAGSEMWFLNAYRVFTRRNKASPTGLEHLTADYLNALEDKAAKLDEAVKALRDALFYLRWQLEEHDRGYDEHGCRCDWSKTVRDYFGFDNPEDLLARLDAQSKERRHD